MAGFPSVIDPQHRNLIYAMDDLLAVTTDNSKDYLLTRFGFMAEHKTYLNDIGLGFQTNAEPVVTPSLNGHEGFQCISDALESGNLNLTDSYYQLKPYSITLGITALTDQLNSNPLPSHELVAEINSKTYSTKLSQTWDPEYRGKALTSSKEIMVEGELLMQDFRRIVLKESFGVAGNGNLIIDSEKSLQQLKKHFTRQEGKNKQVALIMEPFLDKIIDFSSHWEISPDGTLTFLGFQEMINEGFAFNQIRPLNVQWEDLIQQSDYISTINKALQSLHKKGYFGPVCFDSMILKNRSIVPIVEINARMSMGLINLRLNGNFLNEDFTGTLFHISLLVPQGLQSLYATIRKILNQLDLSFTQNSPKGLMILSANTLRVNSQLNPEKPYRARLYLWHVKPKKNTPNSDISRLCTALRVEGIKVQ